MIAAGLDQSIERLVCYTAVLRDDTKNGCVADYRALDRRVEGRGLDSRCRTNTQLRNEGTHFAPQALSYNRSSRGPDDHVKSAFTMLVTSPVGDVKIVSQLVFSC